jgi:Domain of unknown function (DUF397)
MDATWRNSSHSGGSGGGYVEVGAAAEAGRVLVRDTEDAAARCSGSRQPPGSSSPTGWEAARGGPDGPLIM